jgi:AraC family transcriptional regulator of adaptative response / DNA-3-methyladenine glycosylase II
MSEFVEKSGGPMSRNERMAFTGVVTTGIYCRPTCGARPNAENRRSFPTAAAAEAAGFRACLQCRPYRTGVTIDPDLPELVCRGVQLVLDGLLDDHPESVLARRLGVSTRHLRRLFLTHLGATPDQLARSSRAHFARRLLDETDLSITEIAFAAGFGSIRQFNRIMRDTFRAAPRELRAKRRRADRLVADGGLRLRFPIDSPIDWPRSLEQLSRLAVPGVEYVSDSYRRTITIDGAPGVLEMCAGAADHIVLTLHLPFWNGLIHVVQQARHIIDVDRPHGWDLFEAGVVAVLGAGATDDRVRELSGRLVAAHGTPVPGLSALGLSHTFPTPEALAIADLGGLGMRSEQVGAVHALSTAVADGSLTLDRYAGPHELSRTLTSVAGLHPDAVDQVVMCLTGEATTAAARSA